MNQDDQYAKIAQKWEGDVLFNITPKGALKENVKIYVDLWHGKCRGGEFVSPDDLKDDVAFILTATFDNIVKILHGKLDPMQAMMTRKLIVKGSMAYMMRNVPVVLDFVRCAQDVTGEVVGD
ncbi:MAG: SCP2 sterol-binding domain-containing protein [Chloroflexota bacterium]